LRGYYRRLLANASGGFLNGADVAKNVTGKIGCRVISPESAITAIEQQTIRKL